MQSKFVKMILKFMVASFFIQCTWASCSIGDANVIQIDPIGKAKASDGKNDNPLCTTAIRNHIRTEFEASLQYLMMSAHFAQDAINLEGFANFFFKSANEERDHGIKFLDYIKLRGDEKMDIGINNLAPILGKSSWADGTEALRDALSMEKQVSIAIKDMITRCEGVEDFYSADYLIGTWLEEQLHGQRELAGMINTLSNFRKDHEDLADWMFSNTLL